MKTIPLTQGKVALVDNSDYGWLNQYRWHTVSGGRSRLVVYAARHIYPTRDNASRRRRTIYMHKLIMNVKGGIEVKHEDGDTLNNQRNNLCRGNLRPSFPPIARERRLLARLKRKFSIPYRLPLQLQKLSPEQIVREWRGFI